MATKHPGYVYHLHLDRPIGDLSNPRGQAQHYIGWTLDLNQRLATHRSGNGSPLLAAARNHNITITLAYYVIGDRRLERLLKNQHNAPRLCPICNPSGWRHQLERIYLQWQQTPAESS